MDGFNKYAAELAGTFVLVFIGCGSAVFAGGQIGVLGISFAFGLAVLAMVYVIGPISGCHINPAITIAMLTAGKIKPTDAAWYIIAQCFGAIFAAGLLLAIANGMTDYSIAVNGLGQNGYGPGYGAGFTMASAFVSELVLTTIFLLVVFGATRKKATAGFAGVAIGLSLAMIHMVSIPITGTSVNPARSIGPAVFVGGDALMQIPLFVAAPILGGIFAAFIWRYVLKGEEK